MSASLELYRLGIMDYEAARALQEDRRDAVIRKDQEAALFLLQHHPTITLGTLTEPGDLLLPVENLQAQGVTVAHTNRGGRATYHGPGQLVGYPVIDLCAAAESGETGPSVRLYLRGLEEMLVRVLARLHIEGTRVEGETGVWVEGRKIASIGVAVRRWVTTHGFALNVDMDLAAFEVMRPCGFEARIMTSVAQEGGKLPSWSNLEAMVAEEFAAVFDFELATSPVSPAVHGQSPDGPHSSDGLAPGRRYPQSDTSTAPGKDHASEH